MNRHCYRFPANSPHPALHTSPVRPRHLQTDSARGPLPLLRAPVVERRRCTLEGCNKVTSRDCTTGLCSDHCSSSIVLSSGSAQNCPPHARQIRKRLAQHTAVQAVDARPPPTSPTPNSSSYATPTTDRTRAMPMALPVDSSGLNIFESPSPITTAQRQLEWRKEGGERITRQINADVQRRELDVHVWHGVCRLSPFLICILTWV